MARASPDGRLLEVSVCGGVRRYQDVSPKNIGGQGGYGADLAWIDVTVATARESSGAALTR